MKTETAYLDRVAPAVSKSDVPRNDSPITRSLRNRALQNSNTMLEEAHARKKLEKKRQPRRPGIGRCHLLLRKKNKLMPPASLPHCLKMLVVRSFKAVSVKMWESDPLLGDLHVVLLWWVEPKATTS
jgi:hypothetical protein